MKIVKAFLATLLAVFIGISLFIITPLSELALSIMYNNTGNNIFYWLINSIDPNRLYLAVYPLTIAIYAIIYFAWINRRKLKADTVWDAKTGIISSIIIGIAFGAISTLWVKILMNTPLSDIDFIKKSLEYLKFSADNSSGLSFFITLIVAGFLGPVSEELMFRGAVFRILERNVNKQYALIFSSLLFGLVHMSFVQSVYASIMGFISGIVYIKTGKLRWSMLIHITINTVVTVAPVSNPVWIIFTVLMLIPFGVIFYRFFKSEKQENTSFQNAINDNIPV